jgi:excisionase family DNA binding protein
MEKSKKMPGGQLPAHDLLTLKEVANYLRLTPRTVMRRIKAGKICPVKDSPTVFFKREEVMRYIGVMISIFLKYSLWIIGDESGIVYCA